ncbi:MAG: UV DNA damage repair endonuclease UvsE [Desulfobacteraceae bacterium]|nr:MAG: UV DNA damage repair endonuclease UvsE [Desulfobacteraceae bacterium]
MIRLGLCCVFKKEPIRFRRTTAKYVSGLSEDARLRLLSGICLHNAESLLSALFYCRSNGISSFRINSQILPLKTHPEWGYRMEDLPDAEEIISRFQEAGKFSRENNIRTTFHPDQFIVLSSPRPEVVESAVRDLAYHAEVAEWVNADVINIHAGGAYHDKQKALNRFREVFVTLPDAVRKRLTLENDDRLYSPKDLLPVCREMKIPLVYDVHHHRCHPDGVSEEETTESALHTWNREPLFHVSSPINGWDGKNIRMHHDFIDPKDVPVSWLDLDITIEVEAKEKEPAVLQLKQDLGR